MFGKLPQNETRFFNKKIYFVNVRIVCKRIQGNFNRNNFFVFSKIENTNLVMFV